MKKMAKKLIAMVLCVLIALPAISSIGFAEDEVIPVFEPDVEIAVEEALTRGNVQIIDDSGATGGKALQLWGASGEPGNQSSLTGNETVNVSLKFRITERDTYTLRYRYKALNGGTDSVYFSFNGSAYFQPSVSTGSEYLWGETAAYSLTPGEVSFNVIRRESGFILDSVILVQGVDFGKMVSAYSERVYTNGEVEYPKTIDSEDIGTFEKFEDGDRVIFIGDSITHGTMGAYYYKILSNYYNTRYPDISFRIINKGINGDTAPGANKRLKHDIYDEIDEELGGFNKVVIMLGTNDMSRTTYFEGNELAPGAEDTRNALLTRYTSEMEKLVSALEEDDNVEQIILQSPPLFDEFLGVSNKPASPGFSNVVRRAGSIMYDISQKHDKVDFVDINTPQTIIEMYNLEKYGDTFTFIGDRVHPSEEGHYIMAYAFLKAQGESGEVATVEIDVADAANNKVSNATVENVSASANAVSYEYKPNALPLAAVSKYRAAEKLFPVTEELNREIIKVKGLAEGNYDIKLDGKVAITVSADELASGVNIADLEKNPGQQVALNIHEISAQKLKLEANYRTFIDESEIDYIAKYSLNSTSNATLISSAQAWIDANASNSAKEADITNLTNYIKYKQTEGDTLRTIKKYEDEIISRSNTKKYTVEISLSESAAQTIAKPVYTDYLLAQSVLSVTPKTLPAGVSADRVVFSDATGELSSMPTAGTEITTTVEVTNNSDEKKSIVAWVAGYGKFMRSIETQSVELGVGESKTVTLTMNLVNGTNTLKAGLWDSIEGMSPKTAMAEFPSATEGIKSVYIDGLKFEDFDENITSYVYYVHKLQTVVPFVNVVARNQNEDIEIVKASEIGRSAEIKTNGKTYTILFKNEPLPILEDLTINGTTIEGFDPMVYSYSLTADNLSQCVVNATAGDGIGVEVVNEYDTKNTITVTTTSPFGARRVYTIRFLVLGTPGEVTNIKHNGTAVTSGTVVAVPSLGAPLKSYVYDQAELTVSEVYELLKADNLYAEDERYAMYTNRPLKNMWTKGYGTDGMYYGYHVQYMYADTASMFIGENVTRVVTPDTVRSDTTTADASKAIEFDISKGATVYIVGKNKSTYIDGLNKGWIYDSGSKYAAYSPSYKDVNTTINGKDAILRIPTGASRGTDNMASHVFYKHFNAGDHVEIPSWKNAKTYREMGIFIIWDDCNEDAKMFGIAADGVAIDGFNENTLTYSVSVSAGSDVPEIEAIATAGAQAIVEQAATLSDSAYITACGKTYTINFVVR